MIPITAWIPKAICITASSDQKYELGALLRSRVAPLQTARISHPAGMAKAK